MFTIIITKICNNIVIIITNITIVVFIIVINIIIIIISVIIIIAIKTVSVWMGASDRRLILVLIYHSLPQPATSTSRMKKQGNLLLKPTRHTSLKTYELVLYHYCPLISDGYFYPYNTYIYQKALHNIDKQRHI